MSVGAVACERDVATTSLAVAKSITAESRRTIPTNGSPSVANVPSLNGCEDWGGGSESVVAWWTLLALGLSLGAATAGAAMTARE